MLPIRILIALAGVAGVALIGVFTFWIALTDGPPANLTVQNDADAAACTITFEKGGPWQFSLARSETKQKFFPTGVPEISSAVCRSGPNILEATHLTSCMGDDLHTIVLRDEPLLVREGYEEFSIQC
jgi:hypothetical protein